MKGKKFDPQFFSNFMDSCVKKNIDTQAGMVDVARNKISKIDRKIMEAEKLKVVRGKLLDVIEAFGVQSKINVDPKILEFAKIKNPNICKSICDAVGHKSCIMEDFNVKKYQQYDINYCVKQLLEYKVISRVGDLFSRGDMFDKYLDFILVGKI